MTTRALSPSEPEAAQLGLFDSGEPSVDTTFAATRRIQLDATSWIDYVPGWLSGSDQLLAVLRATAGWAQRERWMYDRKVAEPRLTAEYRNLADAPQPLLHDSG